MNNYEAIGRSKFLANLIKENDYKVIAEIGVAKGNNARGILRDVRVDKFYLVDKNIYPETADLKKYPEVIQIKGFSVEVAKTFDIKLDLVFIDGDHNYKSVAPDIDAWLPKVRKGGIIAGHDYDMPDVKRAVKERFKEYDVQLESLGKAAWHPKYFTRVWWRYV